MFNASENAENVRIFQGHLFQCRTLRPPVSASSLQYKVSIRLFLPQEQQEVNPKDKRKTVYWIERTPARHYLQLPRKQISRRLSDLVKEITQGKESPYEKAVALRDYLRSKYAYKLHAEKPPAGRELADFFLFDLKEGHCEYFATTLAVMARLAGIPARIATGFSPGNYNTLTNAFDVYEYHAHAWTQLFFDDKGWLTFDATPPQNIISRTTPLGIGMLRDPFGDEWKISPPELTQSSIDYLKQAILESEKEKKEEISKVDELIAAALNKDALKEKKEVSAKKEKVEKKPESWIGKTSELLKKINNSIGDTIALIRTYLMNHWKLTLPLAIVLLSLLITLKMAIVQLRQRLLIKRALRYPRKSLRSEHRKRHANPLHVLLRPTPPETGQLPPPQNSGTPGLRILPEIHRSRTRPGYLLPLQPVLYGRIRGLSPGPLRNRKRSQQNQRNQRRNLSTHPRAEMTDAIRSSSNWSGRLPPHTRTK